MQFVFLMFKDNLLTFNHTDMFSKSLFKINYNLCRDLSLMNRAESSANRNDSVFSQTLDKLLIYKGNDMGSSAGLCGTPQHIVFIDEDVQYKRQIP